MTLTRKLAPVLLAGTLLISGCGGSEPTDSSSSKSGEPDDSASSDAGSAITGEGYRYELPDGWTERTDDLKEFNERITSGGSAAEATDGFTSNVNLIASPGMGTTFAGKPDALFAQVKSEDAKLVPDLAREDDTELDGAEAVVATGTASTQGTEYNLTQVAAEHDGDLYLLSFSFAASAPDTDRQDAIDAVLDSWKWS